VFFEAEVEVDVVGVMSARSDDLAMVLRYHVSTTFVPRKPLDLLAVECMVVLGGSDSMHGIAISWLRKEGD
jgi:hypothetical protein